jgi:hypothetical protein
MERAGRFIDINNGGTTPEESGMHSVDILTEATEEADGNF